MRQTRWLIKTNETAARLFWDIDPRAKALEPDICGGGYSSEKLLPNLLWLRVFLQAELHIPAKRLGEALEYEMGLIPNQRKRLVFKDESQETDDTEIISFSDILTQNELQLMPFKKSWTGHLEKIRNTPRTRKPQLSQISEGQLNFVSEALNDLTGFEDLLWKCGPSVKMNSFRDTFFCSKLSRAELTARVLENIPKFQRSSRIQGVEPPTKTMVEKALTELVWFRRNKITSKSGT